MCCHLLPSAHLYPAKTHVSIASQPTLPQLNALLERFCAQHGWRMVSSALRTITDPERVSPLWVCVLGTRDRQQCGVVFMAVGKQLAFGVRVWDARTTTVADALRLRGMLGDFLSMEVSHAL